MLQIACRLGTARCAPLLCPTATRNRLQPQALATAMWMCARFHWLPPPELRAAWENAAWARRGQINLIETANISFRWGGTPRWWGGGGVEGRVGQA